jgi:hypothetical protein
LTTVGAQGSVLADPIFKEIGDLFPDVTLIDRTSTHAWSHLDVAPAGALSEIASRPAYRHMFLVGVGMTIADHPSTDPDVRHYRIRLPPRVSHAKRWLG